MLPLLQNKGRKYRVMRRSTRSKLTLGKYRLGLAACGAVVLGASATQAKAQEISEVVVTAQRRETTVDQAPAAITALSARQLESRGIDDVRDLQFAVPSLTIGKTYGALIVAIRGVGNDVGIPAASINVDGVYQPYSASQEAALTDLDRVEVLRGPQGTLYGRNSNAGAINFITRAPTAALEGWASAGFAQYDQYALRGVLNVPLSEHVRSRFSVSYDDRERGFIQNAFGGQDLNEGRTLSGRARVVADLGEQVSVDLALSGFRRSGPFDYMLFQPFSASVVALRPALATRVDPASRWQTTALGPAASEREQTSESVTITWRAPFGTVRSVTAHQRLDVDFQDDRDGTNVNFANGRQQEHADTVTQELTLSGGGRTLNWVGGVFALDDRARSRLLITLPAGVPPINPGGATDRVTQNDTRAYAAFADVTANLTPALRVIGGLRYSEDRITFVNNRLFNLNPGSFALCSDLRTRLSFSSTTYRAGVQYDLAAGQNAYFTTSTGFKSGGGNFNACGDTYEPETIRAYELGYKLRTSDGRLSLRTAAFYYAYDNFQVNQVVGFNVSVTNAASAEVRGFEAELQAQPDDHWTLNGSVTLLDAHYQRFANTDSLDAALGLQDLSGNRLNNAPRLSGSVNVGYRTSMMEWGRLLFDASVTARSRVYFREFNSPEDSQAPYAVVNINAIWRSPTDRYSLRVFANNIMNEYYFTRLLAVDTFGARGGTIGDPRQVGAEFRVNF